MEVLNLFIAASIPVVKVLLLTGLGSFLALHPINLLASDSRNHLNNIVFYVFNPALVSSNLAQTVTYQSLAHLWFMPLNILITFIVGSVLGLLLILITRPPHHLRGLVLGCCAAGNLGNMLLIIIPAICKESGSPFGDPHVCHSDGMAYASLSMAVGAILLWSYVYNMMRISSCKTSKEVEIIDSNPSSANTQPLVIQIQNDKDDQLALPPTRFHPIVEEDSHAFITKIRQEAQKIVKKLNLKRLFAPSTIGAMAGFVVGLVPFIRRSMIGETAPLRVIQDTALLVGEGAIPCLTLIMGANLLKGLQGSETPKSLIVGIVAVRYIGMPVIGIGILKMGLKLGMVNRGDPLYQFVLLLQYALPPAMNIGTITQLFGEGESDCSVIMLWSYGLASLALTFWSTFYMYLLLPSSS